MRKLTAVASILTILTIFIGVGMLTNVNAQSDEPNPWNNYDLIKDGSSIHWSTENPKLNWRAGISREWVCQKIDVSYSDRRKLICNDSTGPLKDVVISASYLKGSDRDQPGRESYGAWWVVAENSYEIRLYHNSRSTVIGHADSIGGVVNFIKGHRKIALTRGTNALNELRQITRSAPINIPN